jgi:hypothetical protein
VCGNHTLRVKLHSAGGNCTLQVEITFVRFEITLVRVAIADFFFFVILGWGGVITPITPLQKSIVQHSIAVFF